jgi:AmmeMemoRadiSam system protein A
MSSNSPSSTLSPESGRVLLDLAGESIRHGLVHRRPLMVDLGGFAPEFALKRATFVTLTQDSQLRGCIGTLAAVRPLAEDVAHNAFAAAFRDPRFPPLEAQEFEHLDIHLSLLTPATPLNFASEADVLGQLMPFEDGLILEDHGRRGTFLPSVWESLPEPAQFLEHLKLKAGLPRNHWSDTVKIWRYRTEVIGGKASQSPGSSPRRNAAQQSGDS